MTKEGKNLTVADNLVVSLDYTVTADGSVVDSSEKNEPIQFIQGLGQVIPGLEKAIYGMANGESKSVVVPPEDAYGVEDPDAIADIPREEFPSQIPLEPGVELQLKNQDDEILEAYIVSVTEESVRLNFNHPLAGKTLHFDISVVDLRPALPEELAHGHVHTHGDHAG